MCLHVEGDWPNLEWHVPGKTERHVQCTVRRLHADVKCGIVRDGEFVTNCLGDGDNLATRVEYAFLHLVIVD